MQDLLPHHIRPEGFSCLILPRDGQASYLIAVSGNTLYSFSRPIYAERFPFYNEVN